MKSTYPGLSALLLNFVLSFSVFQPASAQWNTSGANIYNTNSGNVGIGTTTPSHLLEVKGGDVYTNGSLQVDGGDVFISRTSLNYGYVVRPNLAGYKNLQFAVQGGGPLDNLSLNSNISFFTGKVGVGTQAPGYAMDVRGDIYTNGMLYVDGGDVLISRTTQPYGFILRPNTTSYKNLAFAVTGGGNLDNVLVNSNLTQFNGNVGIGTASTYNYALAVNGSAIFTKAVVKLYPNWPDYVFKKEYQLPSLDSVAAYIQRHQHLPEMPSADSVAKDGLDLGSNQAALLKKIEELTLYLIDQSKKLEKQNEDLEKEQLEIKMLREENRQFKAQLIKLKAKYP